MKNEIKETIDYIFRLAFGEAFTYEYEDIQKARDYITNLQTIEQQYSAILSENAELENKITNLQEKNKKLNDELKRLYDLLNSQAYQDLDNYKSRNEKAIKCIKNKYYKEEYERKGTFTNKLMNILQGEDKDVKD